MIIRNYWNSAWRNLMKRKGFSFINIFGLAVGMASALLILTYVAFEFSLTRCIVRVPGFIVCKVLFMRGKL